jgi:hypothetical protein
MSGNSSRQRGRRFQTLIRQWLEDEGCNVVELGGAGLESTDLLVLGSPNLSCEIKNVSRLDLSGWLDQACEQAPKGALPVVIHKRRGRASAGESYVTLRLEDLRRLLA